MFETMLERGRQAAERAAERRTRMLAERLRAELPDGIETEAGTGGVTLSGRGMGPRFALDPALRWIVARLR